MDKINDINSLVDNASFVDYALDRNNKSIRYWEDYLKKFPEDRVELEKTKQLVLFFNSSQKQLPFTKAKYELKKLNRNIDNREKQDISYQNINSSSQPISLQLWIKVAAIFILFLATTVLLLKIHVLPYELIKLSSLEDSPKNQILVPLGEKSHIILSDGTEIWLNSGSKLTYPTVFNTTNRTVELEGEAYFDVTKNEKKPFIVKTEQLDIEVLGTSFNLKSYPEEDIVETTLIEGAVKLIRENKGAEKTFYLKPYEKAAFSTKENKMKIYKVQDEVNEQKNIRSRLPGDNNLNKIDAIKPDIIESIVSWKDRILVFDSENLIEIATKLERWFGCEIVLNDTTGILNETYTGKFIHNESITMVLDVIKTTTPIDYEITKNKVIIRKKN